MKFERRTCHLPNGLGSIGSVDRCALGIGYVGIDLALSLGHRQRSGVSHHGAAPSALLGRAVLVRWARAIIPSGEGGQDQALDSYRQDR
jgi:hypothetical protein